MIFSTVLQHLAQAARDPGGFIVFCLLCSEWVARHVSHSSWMEKFPRYLLFPTASIVAILHLVSFREVAYKVSRFRRAIAAKRYESPPELPEDFVLYLRTFGTDVRASKFQYTKIDMRHPIDAFTEEEFLCLVLKRAYGEVVALGRPGERLAYPGAARHYAADEEWKHVVKTFASRASLVVIQLHEGDHTKWELRHLASNVPLERVVLLVAVHAYPREFIEEVIAYFPDSCNLRQAYDAHVLALRQDIERVKLGQKKSVLQTEYYSVICFDGSGRSHQASVNWVNGNFMTQELIEALALQKLFGLKRLPLYGTMVSGLGGLECCRLGLYKEHSRLNCRLTSQACVKRREEEAQGWPASSYLERLSCCPLCLKERRLMSSAQDLS
ncbi:hypothetical protein [Streptomyces sp. LN325]|uniref:hypothetical protein n=1 Tax=Streptomyces sp. LN325 TaxID=3112976 RepID=UPI00371CE0D9